MKFSKREKLKSRKRIEQVFQQGKSLTVFPFKVWWLLRPAGEVAVQAAFGAGSRNFKRAVDRNRIKRLSREAYRLQKQDLIRRLQERGLYMSAFFIYTGKDLPDYATVTQKIGVILQKLIKEIS